MAYTLTLQRRVSQRTSDGVLREQLKHICRRALAGSRGKGWGNRIGRIKAEKVNDYWQFTVKLDFEKESGHKSVADRQWQQIASMVVATGKRSSLGQFPWMVIDGLGDLAGKIEAAGEPVEEGGKPKVVIEVKDYGALNLDPAKYSDPNGPQYTNLYDRDHQIKIVNSALRAAVNSNLNNRFHTVLFGPPACGKTELLLATGNMLGKENEAYMKMDATSTTAAGASKILLEAAYVPPVLIVEEIEKTEESSLRWLLGVLDQRAEIRRTNFRIGNKARNVKMLVLATVNDLDLFSKVMSGALASRFPNKVYCPRPSRDVLAKILLREVRKVKGAKEEWIEPTLKFGHDEMKWDDPRTLIPICLQGGDDLLIGKYQESVRATQLPEDIKKKLGVK